MTLSKSEQKIEKQVQFWTILGPFVLLSTLVVLFVKATDENLYIPIAALIGLPFCWKWKVKGLAFSLVFLVTLITLSFGSIPREEWLWQGGLSIALALSFVVTALSAEEAVAIVGGINDTSNREKIERENLISQFEAAQAQVKQTQKELSQVQQNLMKSQQELKQTHLDLSQVAQDLTQTRQDLIQTKQNLSESEYIVELARSEIQTVNQQHEKMAQELIQSKQQTSLLQENLEEITLENAQMHAQVVNHHKESQISTQKLVVQEKLFEEMNLQFSQVSQQVIEAKAALEEFEIAKKRLKDLESEQTQFAINLKASQDALELVQSEKQNLQAELNKFNEPVELADENDIKKLKGLCKHYREQVKDRSDQLDEARNKFFHAEESLTALQKDFDEYQKFEVSESDRAVEKLVAQLDRESNAYKQSLQIELKELHDLVSSLFASKN